MATLRSLNIRITANSSDLEKGLARATKNLTTFSEKATKLGASLSRSLTLPIVGAGGAALKMFADFEKLEKGLAAVMGSSELASKEMMLLKEAAKAPGLGFEEAVKGSVRLQAVGLSADQARRTLEAYGAAIAATGGSAENLDSVQYQLTQMISKNRILAQDFRIIQENVPLLGEALLKAFGTKNIEAIRDSGISATEFNDRIVETLRLMPQVQKATGGLGNTFDNLVDSLQYSAAQFGRMIADSIDLESVMNNIGSAVEGVVRYFKDMDSETRTAIVGWSLLAAAIGPIIFTIGKLTAAYAYLTKVRLALITVEKTANQLSIVSNIKILAVVAAVTALALAATYVAKNWEAFSGRFQNLWTELVWSASNGIRKLKKILNDWQESLGINIWKFKDTEQLKAPDLIDVPSFQSAGEFIKSLGRDLAGLVGIKAKVKDLTPGDTTVTTTTETETGTGTGTKSNGLTFDKSKFNDFVNQMKQLETTAKSGPARIATGFEMMSEGLEKLKGKGEFISEIGDKVRYMRMELDNALTAMDKIALGLADTFSSMAESGATSMSELSKAVVSEIRKMIVAKIRLGVASAIGEKMAAGPFGIFLAAGAGLAASAIFSRILGSLKIPALAQGGAAFGPTLAMVGDNPNAMRDPELIMPFSKMKKMILDDIMPGAGRVQEVRIASSAIEIDGRKLRILLEQENNYARGLR